jgi:hypothetical protein
MAIHEHTTIALYDDGGEQMGNYTRGEDEFSLLDGKHIASFKVSEIPDLIAFLIRVRAMQDDDRPSGTCVYAGTQRDYGDDLPEDDGFITVHPRPRRDGPGLDVKALADLEGRN